MPSEDLDTRGLDQLMRLLTSKPPVAHVGILYDKPRAGSKNTVTYEDLKLMNKPRSAGKTLTNAEIGAIHEFGSTTHPQRSFLRVPIADRLQKEMEASGAFDKKAVELCFKEKSFIPFVKKLAIVGERIVLGAFASGGYGKWPQWKGNYSSRTGDILVDTTQLRNSISSEVVDAR